MYELYRTIKQNPKNTDAFKLGVDTIEGKGYYVIDDVVFKKKYT